MISREKSSRGSNSPRRPTRSDSRKFCCKFSRSPAELARENFPTAEDAHRFACAPSGPCPARVCKPSRSPRRRGAACLSARTCVPRRSQKSFRLRLSARHASRGARTNHSVVVRPHTCVPRRSQKSFRLRLSARTCVPRRSRKSFRLRLSARHASRGARINHSVFVRPHTCVPRRSQKSFRSCSSTYMRPAALAQTIHR